MDVQCGENTTLDGYTVVESPYYPTRNNIFICAE